MGRTVTGTAFGVGAVGLALVVCAPSAHADGRFDTTETVFHEAGGPLHMTVINPSASVGVDLGDAVAVKASYEADIVSGASVAVVDAPSTAVDAITSATKLSDIRHSIGGTVDVGSENTRVGVGYTYGTESDYRSHGLSLFGRTDMFERNTTLEISYGRGFDSVCSLSQPRAQEAVDKQRLPSSDGCFSAKDRESLDLSIQTFQGTWTQAWTPILTTQVIASAQLLDGFQSNPYRAVWLGQTAAQEHHPRQRNRYAVGLNTRLWLKPLEGALQFAARGYRDTWNIRSITGELGYEQNLFAGLSLRGRARFYAQTGAAFFSDDYAFRPVGQYFTGDRELSPMRSWTFGGRLRWDIPSGDDGSVLGFMSAAELVFKADVILHEFLEFTYSGAPVPNPTALMGTFGFNATF
ncbi:MAG: DUF3570 domain-containing protein [Polyangiales bacterium]|nr:DUF3570 domain-containing protein [Myxococcales bacterium]